MPGIPFSKKLGRWESLNDALKRHLAEVPELATVQEELEELIGVARAAEQEQRELRGKLQSASRLRRQMELKGQDLRAKLAAELSGRIGPGQRLLLPLCGVTPRRQHGRRARHAPDLTAPEPPGSASH
jgi:MoxR-like ATPase